MEKITIAIDVMGGDHGPSVTVPAALQVLTKLSTFNLILVGDESVIKKYLKLKKQTDMSRIIIRHATQLVLMDESPSNALRTKKDSSMRVAINLVKEKQADACVSAGNTGALMVTSRFVLKTLPGIDRPAIISSFPTLKNNKKMRMLDLGANVDSSPENLFQFAVMGSVLTSALDNIKSPKIGLLNIGEEDIKGNELVRDASQKLSSINFINYQGYIEGDQIYTGDIDVVVCDGFVGNVALKTSEGVAKLIGKLVKNAFTKNIFTRIAALITLPVIKSIVKRMDPDRYNGASLIGLRGIVIKSHGGAKINAFSNAIKEAVNQAEKNITSRISSEVERILNLSSKNST
ncbi:phosphate acyltransferase PlsX [Gammaproteobacteria bacterium]|nr:phosphate acyltransferase PlsX [Gammaproteobacteria bacterium]